MPKLTIGGTEIKGVQKATVRVVHLTDRDPERLPVMEWEIIMGIQDQDMLAKWALAPQGSDRFKRCELVIYNRDKTQAHTWTMLKGYLHQYSDVEFPERGGAADTTDQGFYTKLVIRGTIPQAEDYDGVNVMTVAPGEKEGLPG